MADDEVQAPALESSVQVLVSVQTNDTTLVPLSVDQSLPTPKSSPILCPRDVKGKGKEIKSQTDDFLPPPSSPHTLRSSSPTPFPRISNPFSQTHRHAPTTLPASDELGEAKSLARAQSVMSMSSSTSTFASLKDVVMAEAELSSLPEPLDGNSLKPPEVQNISIRMCEDVSAEYNQESIETSQRDVFSRASSEAPPSQCSQPFKSLSNQQLSYHLSLPPAQSQSQHSEGHRRKCRRLEEHTREYSVPETENSGIVQATSLVSALGRTQTEEFIDGSHGAAHPHYRSFRGSSPDPSLDTTSELMSSSHEYEQCPSATLPRNLVPSRSAPLLVAPPQLEASSYRKRNEPLATSTTFALVTLTSPRTLASTPTIPLVLGDASTISLALSSSSKVPQPSFVTSEKSSNSRSAERRKRREIAERLCLARPDLVDPSYAAKRSRRLSQFKEQSVSIMQDIRTSAISLSSSRSISAQTNGPSPTRKFCPGSRLSSFSSSKQVAGTAPAMRWRELLDEDTEDVHQTMNWERSRTLARDITGALAAGRNARDVLPRLMCISARRRHPAG